MLSRQGISNYIAGAGDKNGSKPDIPRNASRPNFPNYGITRN